MLLFHVCPIFRKKIVAYFGVYTVLIVIPSHIVESSQWKPWLRLIIGLPVNSLRHDSCNALLV